MVPRTHRSQAPGGDAVAVDLAAHIRGRLIAREKRFLAHVELADGRVVTAHCPDPGRMRGLLRRGAAVRCSVSDSPRRRLAHTLELIRVGRGWVGVHPARANALVRQALLRRALPELAAYSEIQSEVRVPGAGGRLDFRLDGAGRQPPLWLEVKSVTLAQGEVARFPDSVTVRGRRHAETLAALRAGGARAVLLFLVQRGDCRHIEPADDIDPAYGAALRAAATAGVEIIGWRARLSPHRMELDRPLEVAL